MPSVSIVITTYKRDRLLSNTLASISGSPEEVIVVDDANDKSTSELCRGFGATYLPRLDRPNVEFSNPSVPINMGLRVATGDIVILQNAECKHDSHAVDQFRELVIKGEALFAKVKSLNEDGSFSRWYVAPQSDERPYFFCGAMLREHFVELGGMDEDFKEAGFDDDDFAYRIQKAGIRYKFSNDILITHQWHERPVVSSAPSYELYNKKHGGRVWM